MANLPKLDRIDVKILAELQSAGRLKNAELAERIGLSPSPCSVRLRRLEKAGYITGYNATINIKKFGSAQIVFTALTLSEQKREFLDKFEQRLAALDELMECYLIGGSVDYFAKFIVRNISHYQELIDGVLAASLNVAKYSSYVVIRAPIIKTQLPIKMISGYDD